MLHLLLVKVLHVQRQLHHLSRSWLAELSVELWLYQSASASSEEASCAALAD